MAVLEVSDLVAGFRLQHGSLTAVDGLSLTVEAGECVGVVGESGCGKSTMGLAVMGLLPPNAFIGSGSIRLDGRELVGLPEAELRHLRGNAVAMVPQDPLASLNPTMRIGRQIAEGLSIHRGASRAEGRARALEVLEMVEVPRPRERLDQYPHELSGGLRQRVMIAMALACEPKLLIADEPTTALDVTIQAQILDLLDGLRRELDMGVLLVTHDMGVIAGRTDRVVVMYAGEAVEEASTEEAFSAMRHPYTAALLAAVPSAERGTERLEAIPGVPPDLAQAITGCRFAPRCPHADARCGESAPPIELASPGHRFACFHPVDGPLAIAPAGPRAVAVDLGEPILEVADLVVEYPVYKGGLLRRRTGSVKAVSDVGFTIHRGEVFGLVGESGCGKSTVAKAIAGLERPRSGSISFAGDDLGGLRGAALRAARAQLQLMFQDPYASLDPRMSVGSSIREPLDIHKVGTHAERQAKVAELLGEVGLAPTVASRFPHEFSGGQRQRVGFARALALGPDLLIADEPVSALDVSVQAQLLNLMKDLQERLGLAMLLVSHDLGVVRYMAARTAVMYLGRIVELGPTEQLLTAPVHPYTRGLIEAVPVPDVAEARSRRGRPLEGELPSPVDPPSGCRFRTRCPLASERCAAEQPAMATYPGGVQAACHHPLVAAVELSRA